jgi:hypothetical protein
MPKYDLQKYKIPVPNEFETRIEETIVIAPKYDLTKYKIPTPVNQEIIQVDRYGIPLPEYQGDSDIAILGKSSLKG